MQSPIDVYTRFNHFLRALMPSNRRTEASRSMTNMMMTVNNNDDANGRPVSLMSGRVGTEGNVFCFFIPSFHPDFC